MRCLRFRELESSVAGLVPDVDAPEGSGGVDLGLGACAVVGRVPEVEGIGEECGELEDEEPLEPDCGGEGGAGSCTGSRGGYC